MKRKLFITLLMCGLLQLPAYAEATVFNHAGDTEVIELNLLTDEELLQIEATPAINGSGTGAAEAVEEQLSNESYTYLGSFKLSAYCECRICNEKWVGTPTKLGTDYVEGRTIAVDPKIIPLGSIVDINIPGEGWHRYRAEDIGGAIKQNKIDIFVQGHSNCGQVRYNGYCDVRLVK
jgi:3D (Asp-Asp-Asp) domain-containing protein